MSAMMATNGLTSEHGSVHLSLEPERSVSPGASAVARHGPTSALGLLLLPLYVGKVLLTARVADNASILEPLSSKATKEIHYL